MLGTLKTNNMTQEELEQLRIGDTIEAIVHDGTSYTAYQYYRIKAGLYEYKTFRISPVSKETESFIISEDYIKTHYKVKEKQVDVSPLDITKSIYNRVEHPSHYTWLKDKCGIEVIDITRHLNFNIGNIIKYTLRAGHKKEEGMTNKDKQIEDLKKARFYINDEIKRLENENS